MEALTAAHAEAMFPVLSDPALYTYLDDAPPISVDDLRAVYRRREAGRSPDGTERWFNWMLRLPEEGYIGFVQASMAHPQACWVGYLLCRAAQGRGLATRAVACAIDHLRAQGAQRLLASVEAENRASIALLERLGFAPASPALHAEQALAASERLYVRDLER